MQIGRVAQSTGLSVDTIRFYEKQNLIPLLSAPTQDIGSTTKAPSIGCSSSGGRRVSVFLSRKSVSCY